MTGEANQNGDELIGQRLSDALKLSMDALDDGYRQAVKALEAVPWPVSVRRFLSVYQPAGGTTEYALAYDRPADDPGGARQILIEYRAAATQPIQLVAWGDLSEDAKVAVARQLPGLFDELRLALQNRTARIAATVEMVDPLVERISVTGSEGQARLHRDERRLESAFDSAVRTLEVHEVARLGGEGGDEPLSVRDDEVGGYGLLLQSQAGEVRVVILSDGEQPMPAGSFAGLALVDRIRVARLLPQLVDLVEDAYGRLLRHAQDAMQKTQGVLWEAQQLFLRQQPVVMVVRAAMERCWALVVANFKKLEFIGQADIDLSAAGPAADRLHLVRRSGNHQPRVTLIRGGGRIRFADLPVDEQLRVLEGVERYWQQLRTDLPRLERASDQGVAIEEPMEELRASLNHHAKALEDNQQRWFERVQPIYQEAAKISQWSLASSERKIEYRTATHSYELAIELRPDNPGPVVYQRSHHAHDAVAASTGAELAASERVQVQFAELPTAAQVAVLYALPEHCATIAAATASIADRATKSVGQLELLGQQLSETTASWSRAGSYHRERLEQVIGDAIARLVALDIDYRVSVSVKPPAGAAGWDDHLMLWVIDAARQPARVSEYRLAHGVFGGIRRVVLLSRSGDGSSERVLSLEPPDKIPLALLLAVVDALGELFEALAIRHVAEGQRIEAVQPGDRARDALAWVDWRARSRQHAERVAGLDTRIAEQVDMLLTVGWGVAAEVEVFDENGDTFTNEGIVLPATHASEPAVLAQNQRIVRTVLAHRVYRGEWSLLAIQSMSDHTERVALVSEPRYLTLQLKLALTEAIAELIERLDQAVRGEVVELYGPRTERALTSLRLLEQQLEDSLNRVGLLSSAGGNRELAVAASDAELARLQPLSSVASDNPATGAFASLRRQGRRIVAVLLRRDGRQEQCWYAAPLNALSPQLRQAFEQLVVQVEQDSLQHAAQIEASMRQWLLEVGASVDQLDERARDAVLDARSLIDSWHWPLAAEVALPVTVPGSAERFSLIYDGRARQLLVERAAPEGSGVRVSVEQVEIEVRLAALAAMPTLGRRLRELASRRLAEIDDTSLTVARSLKQWLGMVKRADGTLIDDV